MESFAYEGAGLDKIQAKLGIDYGGEVVNLSGNEDIDSISPAIW